MKVVDAATASVAIIGASILLGIGSYGLASSRNLIRQLLSIEVLFNAILVFIVVLTAFNGVLATGLSLILISVVSGEVIVLVAVIVAYYRVARSLESSSLEEEGV